VSISLPVDVDGCVADVERGVLYSGNLEVVVVLVVGEEVDAVQGGEQVETLACRT